MRNKLFFFGDYQRTVDNLGYVVRATIPTMRDAQWRLQRRRQRHLRSADGRGEWQRPHGVPEQSIPQDRISPIARRLIAMIPEPNISGAPLGQNNYQKAQVREKTTDAFDTKVNYSLNERTRSPTA